MTSKVLTYILGAFCIFITCVPASGQEHPDSLFAQAKQLLSENQRDSAVSLAEQILEMDIADTLQGRVEHFVGYVMSNRYRYDDALPHLMRAIHILEPTGEFEALVADAYLKAGQCSRDPEVKHALTSQAIVKFEQLNDSVNMAAACLNLGLLCFRQGQIEKFRMMGAQGLNWLGDADRPDLRTRLHYAQGRYYNATGNFEIALLFFEKCYNELIATNPRDPFIFNICKDYGLLLADLGYFDEAVMVLKMPILPDSESKSPHRSYAEAGMLFDLGKVYMDAAEFALAE